MDLKPSIHWLDLAIEIVQFEPYKCAGIFQKSYNPLYATQFLRGQINEIGSLIKTPGVRPYILI